MYNNNKIPGLVFNFSNSYAVTMSIIVIGLLHDFLNITETSP